MIDRFIKCSLLLIVVLFIVYAYDYFIEKEKGNFIKSYVISLLSGEILLIIILATAYVFVEIDQALGLGGIFRWRF